jgi:rhamnosyl/mannosyltransferase
MAESLKQQAKDLAISNVIFAGQVSESEKISLIKRSRALILPSHLRSEAYGMVLVEAAMYGRPLISCEIGTGTSYINAHDETGLVVPPEDPKALAGAINRLLNQNELAEKFGFAARKRYEQFFSGEAMGHAYASLFIEVAVQK